MALGFKSFVLAAAVLFVTPAGPAAGPSARAGVRPVQVLVLSGQNNHDWKSTTPKLVSILKLRGQFDVSVTEDPSALAARSLRPFDVLLSNWNAFLWPLIAINSDEMRTVAVEMFFLEGKTSGSAELGMVLVGAVLSALPVIILYLVFQRRIVGSLGHLRMKG